MKKMFRLKPFFGAMLMLLAVASCQQQEELVFDDSPISASKNESVPGHYIVKYKLTSLPAGRFAMGNYEQATEAMKNYTEAFLRKTGVENAQLTHSYVGDFSGFAATLSNDDLLKLKDNPAIEYIEPNYTWALDIIIEDIVLPSNPTALAQSTPWGITRVGGAGNGAAINKRIWVIDTGVDIFQQNGSWVGHSDLNVDVNACRAYLNNGGVYTMPANATTIDDGHGHGTHVAGSAAALNNTIGVVGVAAGAKVVGIKVLSNSGSGSNADVIAGCNYVANTGVAGDVANLSLGGSVSTALDNAVKAIAAKGIKVAVAAGNNGADANNYSPARANATNLFTVAAITSADKWASYSNYGTPVDYAEPGSSVYSCYKDNGYATMSGTSMASPHLAGILFLGAVQKGGTVKKNNVNYTIGKR